ncbi:gp16 [Mycobacterium phage PBI1]|uniref:Minor capsid protein n=4 Tax=Plotvirus TaxID=2169613 RepID=A0A2Z4Q1W1_9CAUD|nr:gp16 [Mycobacterium phage PBI1]ABD58432.1 minor capsid protein [Mycobacterium phage PBI1]ACD49601.1 minor capsid protein [Mycobacterium phage Adjutor]ACI06303.1 minor capsid protein [Mycobacterium phage Butterscotch]AWY03459.1 minor capsid protein [Mycobacterium phage Erk16]
MARYDKYNPYGGGFRAPLAADWTDADAGKLYAVGINNVGAVVKGAGQSGVAGVLVLTKGAKAGSIVDVMKFGEVVEFGPTSGTPGTDFGAAGTAYYADTSTGAINSTSGEAKVKVGHTVGAQRLIVAVADGVVDPSPAA